MVRMHFLVFIRFCRLCLYLACETRPRGQYKLLEQALQDRTCGTEANNYVSSLFPESKTAQSDVRRLLTSGDNLQLFKITNTH